MDASKHGPDGTEGEAWVCEVCEEETNSAGRICEQCGRRHCNRCEAAGEAELCEECF